MTSRGGKRTKQGGPMQKRDRKDEEGAGPPVRQRFTFISGPTVCYPNRIWRWSKGRVYGRAY